MRREQVRGADTTPLLALQAAHFTPKNYEPAPLEVDVEKRLEKTRDKLKKLRRPASDPLPKVQKENPRG